MTGRRKQFLEKDDVYAFSTAGTYVNTITMLPLDYAKTHTGVVSGTQIVSIQGVAMTEVAFANIDLTASIGKYAVTSGNAITFAVDKAVVTTLALAENYVEGVLVDYELNTLTASGTAIYTVDSYLSDSTFVGQATGLSLDSIATRIEALDDGINMNSVGGYPYHVISRSKTAS